MSMDGARILGGVTLGAWAAMFWFVLITDRTDLYLSSRTDWVVPLGAIALTVAAIGRLASGVSAPGESLRARDLWASALLIVPVVVVLSMPPAALGSYAAGKRAAVAGGAYYTSPDAISSGPLTFVKVAGAVRSREGMRALVRRAGEEVTFVGFVTTDSGAPADEFTLNRFVVSCCVADALAVRLRVVDAPPGRIAKDQWVEVTGKLYPLGRQVIIDASSVKEIDRPRRPYLSA